MAEVIPITTIRFPEHRRVNSEFVPSRLEENKRFAEEDLAKSGLTPEDVDAIIIGDLAMPSEAIAGYIIPYTSPDGSWLTANNTANLAMWRIRLKYPDTAIDPQRYSQPKKEELEQYDIPSPPPYIPKSYHEDPHTDILVICEGEKKAAATHKFLGYSAIGIGGCQNWQFGTVVHPWILQIVKKHKEVWIVPDGDLWRYDICKAYGNFSNDLIRALEGTEIDVKILTPQDKIDDLLIQWGPEAEANFSEIPQVKPDDLVEDSARLARRYDLAFRQGAKGDIVVEQHTSNVTRLIIHHPAFPEIWRNEDTQKVHIGERELIPEVTDMEIANHFQHNFSMPRVTNRMVRDVIKALADNNSRSPFLGWVESQIWDGEERLDTWLTRLWHVPDSAYIRQVGSRWLIASVARQRTPGVKFDWMPIVTGPQGIGKSSMPIVLFKGHYVNMYGHVADKDAKMLLHTGLCIVVDEMDALNKSETTFWKSMLSTQEDIFRPPYGASVRHFKRRSVMYGTTNSRSFLQNDRSGFRRYMPFTADRLLDFEGLKMEMGQLWAEAAHRHSNGETFDRVDAEFAKEDYVVEDPTETRILDYILTMCTRSNKFHCVEISGEVCWEFTLSDVMTELGMPHESPVKAREAKNILRDFGAKPVAHMKIKNGRGLRITEAAVKELQERG